MAHKNMTIKTEKSKFWDYLNSDVQNAKKEGAGIIIQIDGNSWAGDKINPGDPKIQNMNGK